MGSGLFFIVVSACDPVVVLAPVWLHEGGVDVCGGGCGALCAHGLYETCGGEVDCVSQDASGTGGDEVQGGGIESAVCECAALELA